MAVRVQREVGIETILHVCGRDRNLLATLAHLLGAHDLGVRNLVVITGDPPKMGDFPDATAVYDLDSIGILKLADPAEPRRRSRRQAARGDHAVPARDRRRARGAELRARDRAPEGQEGRGRGARDDAAGLRARGARALPRRRRAARAAGARRPLAAREPPQRRVPAQRGARHAGARGDSRADAQGGQRRGGAQGGRGDRARDARTRCAAAWPGRTSCRRSSATSSRSRSSTASWTRDEAGARAAGVRARRRGAGRRSARAVERRRERLGCAARGARRAVAVGRPGSRCCRPVAGRPTSAFALDDGRGLADLEIGDAHRVPGRVRGRARAPRDRGEGRRGRPRFDAIRSDWRACSTSARRWETPRLRASHGARGSSSRRRTCDRSTPKAASPEAGAPSLRGDATRDVALYTVAPDARPLPPLSIPQRRDDSLALDLAFAGTAGLARLGRGHEAPRGVVKAAVVHAGPRRRGARPLAAGLGRGAPARASRAGPAGSPSSGSRGGRSPGAALDAVAERGDGRGSRVRLARDGRGRRAGPAQRARAPSHAGHGPRVGLRRRALDPPAAARLRRSSSSLATTAKRSTARAARCSESG